MAAIPIIGFLSGSGNAIVINVDVNGNFSLSNNLPPPSANSVPVYCISAGAGSVLKIVDNNVYTSTLANQGDATSLGVPVVGLVAGFVSNIILDPINDAIIAGPYVTSFAALFGNNFAALFDNFNGVNGTVNGRQPTVGNAWGTNGANAAGVVISGNELTQNTSGGAGFATNDLVPLPGEIGCTFRVTGVENRLTVGGAVSVGSQLVVNIYPTSSATFYQVVYTLVAGDTTLAIAATNFAAAITANSFSVSNAITATATGATVAVKATECPKLASAVSGTVTLTQSNSPAPTLINYPTGQNFANGMLHFRLGIDGVLDWQFYNNGVFAFTSLNSRTPRGLQAGQIYTYRCCIAPPYVWGGLWIGSTLINGAVGQDSNMGSPSYRGKSMGLENGIDANGLYYDSAWAYQNPSISRAAIQKGLT